jgi:serine/threonine protein kinase
VRTETQVTYRADGALARLLPFGDRQWLADTRFGLFSPLVGCAGTLLGIVGIGESRNGLPYVERQNMLIAAMSGQAALKLDNTRLNERSGDGRVGDAPTMDWENEPATRCPLCALMWPPTKTHCSCGSATIEAALPLVVKGKFRVDRFIGAGGTGVVYHAVDLALDRQVAIKTLPAIRLKHSSRLYLEARAMANVMHPNLALIYGAERWKGTPLLIFEYLDGGTLLDSLRSGALTIEETIGLGTLLADALDRVHASGVLHRDIKPSNIGYTSDGVPKLLDFGLAWILDRSRDVRTPPAALSTDLALIEELTWGVHPSTSLTLTQQLIGTPLYLSPEALAGQPPDPSFDLWGLSMVLYEAVAGCHPVSGNTVIDVVKNVQQGTMPDVRRFRADCPDIFAEFLNDSLSPMVARRPATAAALRTRLRSLHTTLFAQAV